MTKKLFITAGFCLALIISGSAYAAGTGSTPKGKPFIEIQGQFVEVQGQIKSLEEQMDDLVGQVESIELRVSANETAITGLEAANVVIQQQISDLFTLSAENSTEITNALAQITDLQTQINELKLAPDANALAIADLESQVKTLQDFVVTSTEGFLSLKSELINNSSLIAAFQAQIDQINIELAKKQDVLTGTCPAGSALVSFDGLGTIECTSIDASAGVQRTTVTKIFQVPGYVRTYHPKTCWSYSTNSFTGTKHWFSYSCGHYTSSGGWGYGVAQCPDGSGLVGGGFVNDSVGVNITDNRSYYGSVYPDMDVFVQQWYVRGTTTSATTYDLYVIADCVTPLP